MTQRDKPLVWLRGEVKTPPFSAEARVEAGILLRRLQRGERLGMPHSRPNANGWCAVSRVAYRGRAEDMANSLPARPDAIVIADVFQKATKQTPTRVIQDCRRRLSQYDAAGRGD
jgi:hypothetical protein